MAIYKTSNKVKLYLGNTKVRKVYRGTVKIYSSGNIVTYIVDGSTYHTQEYEEGQSVLSPSKSPTKSGYTFLGWSTSASGNILASLTMGDSPITLYAQFVQTAAWNFGYTGGIQTWVVPVTGLYLLTCYGAAGGSSGYSGAGGAGGTTKKYAVLNKGTTLHVVCGGMGISGTGDDRNSGGYNGGGPHTSVASYSGTQPVGGGGGATHIATSSGLLNAVSSSTVLCIAGGGGGSARDEQGGVGGGSSGGKSVAGTEPGTQSSGYQKGQGGRGYNNASGGGGGGYYGGFGGLDKKGGGGGSGYIGSSTTTFKGKTYTNTTSQGGNNGNGSASIQFIAA